MRLWERADELGLARLIFVNMLDRERADFFRTLESLKDAFGPHAVATEIPIGSEHEVRGVIDLIDMKAYEYERRRQGQLQARSRSRTSSQAQAEEYREKLIDEVAENSDELMERYLEGEEISHEETVARAQGRASPAGRALPGHLRRGDEEPGRQPAARRARRGPAVAGEEGRRSQAGGEPRSSRDEDAEPVAFVFKTLADPFAGRINLFRVYQGVVKHDSHLLNCAPHAKERIGQLLDAAGQGDGPRRRVRPRRHRRGGQAQGDARRRRAGGEDRRTSRSRCPRCPAPVMAFAIEPKAKGDEEKVGQALRRLQEEDPTIDFHRDPQTGEQIVAGLSQIHVEVIVERMKEPLRRRGQPEAAARPVPGDDQGQAPRRTAATRSRPAAAASSATATSRSSRCRTARASSSSTRSRAA